MAIQWNSIYDAYVESTPSSHEQMEEMVQYVKSYSYN